MNTVDQENKKITIVSEDGTEEVVDLLFAFVFNDTKKEYAVYTRNEKDENGNITIYVSSVIHEDGKTRFAGVESDEDWSRIKDVLRELSKKE